MGEFEARKLFRITLKGHKWERKKSLYVIAGSKDKAIKYINEHKKNEFEIYEAVYLGDEVSGVCFSPNIKRGK